jgi:pimeloyl-ACP methyl ester carboxylesterase
VRHPLNGGVPEPASAPAPLHCRDEGQGPVVLLVHGLGSDHSVWDGQVTELAKEFRVLAPDLRGHGRSAAPPGSTFTFAEMEGDLGRLLDERQVANVHLVGMSAGGFLAMRWALDAPGRLRSLTLIGSSVHCDNHTKAVAQRWAETYRDEGFDAYVLRLVKDLFYPDWVDQHLEIVEVIAAQQRTADLPSVFAWGQTVRSFDLRGRLLKIRLPTRVLQGMDDAVVDGSHARLLRVSIPGADLKLFAQTGHLVPWERPQETTEAVREFLRSVERTRGAAPA